MDKKENKRVDRAKNRRVTYKDETDAQKATLPQRNSNHLQSGTIYGRNSGDLSRSEAEDQLTTEIERQMIRGITNEYRLRDLLNIPDIRTVRLCIRKVYNRWSVMGSRNNQQRLKGEILTRLETVQEEAWDMMLEDGISVKDRISTLRLIADTIRTTAEIQGVKQVGASVNINNISASNSHEVVSQMAQRKSVQEIASEFTRILEQNRGRVIDHE